jgi:hypothetical protein
MLKWLHGVDSRMAYRLARVNAVAAIPQSGMVYAMRSGERIHNTMTKPLDQIDEVVHNPKHPFRQVDDRPEKPQKHRYERRKVKEFIRAGDWMPGK